MDTRTKMPKRPGHNPGLGNERGMVLVITMIIMLVVSTLAAANLINAFLERSLAKNQNYASIALNAADAGVQASLAWLNTPANSPLLPGSTGNKPPLSTDPWLQGYLDFPAGALDRSLTSGGSVSVLLSLKTDAEDQDGDGDTAEIVLFNNCATGSTFNDCFHYKNSFYGTATGIPVVHVVAEGRASAGGHRRIEMDVGNNKLNVRANGAVTAMGNVAVTGNIKIDGRSHTSDGALGGTCTEAYVGVNVPAPRDLNGDGDTTDPGETYKVDEGGSSNPAGDPTGTGTSSKMSYSPDQALGLCDQNGDGDCDDGGETVNIGGGLDTYIGGLPAEGQIKDSGNIRYVNTTGDYDISASAQGVLIVHNPLFDPRVWKCSAKVVPNPVHPGNRNLQIANPDLVAPPATKSNDCYTWNTTTNTHDRPFYDNNLYNGYETDQFAHMQTGAYAGPLRPRNLTGNSNVTFKGAIVADQVNPINGNITIIGAIISLSGVSIAQLGTGSASVLYSCDALNIFTSQGYVTKIDWHRVY